MTSPPETDREYAYFQAVGVDDPKEISSALQMEPDSICKVGDEFERRGRTFQRRASSWRLDSGLTDRDPLSEHLKTLLWSLEPKRDALFLIREKFKTQFVCVGFYYQNFSWELDFDLQRRATALGIGFWFDTYSDANCHEEIVELREQLGIRKALD
jgi:hypothetical protein